MPHALGWGWVGWGIGRGAFQLQCKLQCKCLCKLGGVGVGAFLFLPIFIPLKGSLLRIRPLRNIVYTSRFSAVNPKSSNTRIYHFHISESLNLDFFKFWGRGGGDN